jgi:uncharacterized protein (DUF1684 family)
MKTTTVTSALLCALLTATTFAQTQTPDYAHLRAERAQALTQPYGWFSLIGLESLKPGTTTVGSAKDNTVVLPAAPAHVMSLAENNGAVTLTEAAPGLRYGAAPAIAGTVIAKGEGDATALSVGTLRLWAIDRGGKRYLRIKDANAPALLHFSGLKWYAPDAHLRIEARWVPFTTPHTMNVLNKLGQITPTPVPGYAEFTLDGRKLTLTPMGASPNQLWFVFRDATYLHTTDGGGRFLYTPGPSNGLNQPGTVTLDFNLAENPPCAYSPYATCPLAAPENRLPIPVAAGEKRYE